MSTPAVLSVREFRAGLAATVERARGGNAVFVGSHRRAEVVVVSVEQYEHLVRSAQRREAVAEALASVRAEGGEPSVETLAALERLARGDIDEDKLREQLRRRYQH